MAINLVRLSRIVDLGISARAMRINSTNLIVNERDLLSEVSVEPLVVDKLVLYVVVSVVNVIVHFIGERYLIDFERGSISKKRVMLVIFHAVTSWGPNRKIILLVLQDDRLLSGHRVKIISLNYVDFVRVVYVMIVSHLVLSSKRGI